MSTFENQEKLPKLPLPELEETLDRYLVAIRPLVSDAQYAETEQAVQEFLESNGPQLHEELKAYNEQAKNYVDSFWLDSYLQANCPLVLNINPIFVLEDDPTPSRNSQVLRAASLILSAAKFVRAVRQETLSPDVIRKVPLDMSQFKYLFSCARYPVFSETGEYVQDKVISFVETRHIVVMCLGQFYYFDIIWPDGTLAITQREIARNLERIIHDATMKTKSQVSKEAVGVLTTEERSVWANIRKRIVNLSNNNKKTMEMIDSALFVLCLDQNVTDDVDEITANMLHGSYHVDEDGDQTGSCINRWYDKLQIIVTKSGNAGVNFEHSKVDGHSVLRFASDIFTDTIVRFAQSISGVRVKSFISEARIGDTNGTGGMNHAEAAKTAAKQRPPETRARKLEFDLEDRTKDEIRYAERKLSDVIMQNDTHCVEFIGYGGDFIKQSGMSPDAFVQIALLTTYAMSYGYDLLPTTYESVMTKQYLFGRTEAGRSSTMEAFEFIKLWGKKGVEPSKKLEALRVATKAHSKMTGLASKGLGCDRHLFALKSLFQKNHPNEPLPEIFTDASYSVLNTNILSTSNCGNPSLRFFGFGPVSSQGYGCGYLIREDGLSFCLTSKNRQTKRFGTFLRKYLGEVQDLILSMNPHSSTPRSLEIARADDDHGGYSFFLHDSDEVPFKNIGTEV